MKQEKTFFLKIAVIIIGLPIAALCIMLVPQFAFFAMSGETEVAFAYWTMVVGLYATAIPFFYALYQAILLLTYIDKSIAFSELSVKALRAIKYCANLIVVGFILMEPFIFFIADEDDAPGAILIGAFIGFVAFCVAIFANILQKLFQEAIDMKEENDLTV